MHRVNTTGKLGYLLISKLLSVVEVLWDKQGQGLGLAYMMLCWKRRSPVGPG